jgi:hypothetical protein
MAAIEGSCSVSEARLTVEAPPALCSWPGGSGKFRGWQYGIVLESPDPKWRLDMEINLNGGDGFDEIDRKLRKLQENIEAVEGSHDVRVEELLTRKFLSACSRFQSLEEFFEGAGIHTDADLDAKDATEFDGYVAANTSYPNWSEMLGAAGEQYAVNKIDLDL